MQHESTCWIFREPYNELKSPLFFKSKVLERTRISKSSREAENLTADSEEMDLAKTTIITRDQIRTRSSRRSLVGVLYIMLNSL